MTDIKVKQVDSYIFRITDGKPIYLMLKRSDGKHYEHLWQGVAGKIENGETALQTIIRELKEEIGKSPHKIFTADHVASFYEARRDFIHMVPIFGIEIEDENIVLSDEHCEYKWVTFEEALKLLTWKGQKEGLKVVHDMIVSNDDRIRWLEIKLR